MLSAIFLLSALRFKILTSPFHYVLMSLKIARWVTLFTFLWIMMPHNTEKISEKKIIKRDMLKIYLPITYPV